MPRPDVDPDLPPVSTRRMVAFAAVLVLLLVSYWLLKIGGLL